MNIRKSILIRVRLAFLLMLVLAITISWKVIDIQSNSKWKNESLQQRIKPMEVKAGRGNIYAADGSILATSIPEYELRFDTQVMGKKQYENYIHGLCDSLSKMFPEEGKSSRSFFNYIDANRGKKKRFLKLVSRSLKYHEIEAIKKWPAFYQKKLRGGIIFPKTEKRRQPFVLLAKKTIGSFNDSVKRGTRGIEFSFQQYLSGTDGLKYHEREDDGSWRPLSDEEAKKTEHGLDVHTTLDINLQDVSESELMKALSKNQAQKGCVILMEVETGEIKAMANLSRVISRGDTLYKEIYNHAVAGAVNPGSTIKLASVMAILEHTDIEPEDSVETGKGVYKFYNTKLRDSHWGGHGKITLQRVFEVSSNIGIAKLCDTLFNKSLVDQEIFLKFFKEFGLATDLDFQIYGSTAPKIPNPESSNWSGITIPWLSIGYESQMTPLQIVTFYNGVANDGKMIQPIIVNRIMKSGQVVKDFKPKVIQKQLCSKETLAKVKKMLEGVVERGTAENIRTDKYKIAGKTGTTQKIKNGHYVKEYYTSFVGYFPADKPKYTCIVIVDNPQKNKYGNTAAAPVFRAIADYIHASDLNLHDYYACEEYKEPRVFPVIRAGYYEDLLYLCDQLKVPHKKNGKVNGVVRTRLVDEKTKVDWKPLTKKGEGTDKNGFIILPDLKELTVKDVVPLLENMQLRVRYEGAIVGRVSRQLPVAGSKVAIGQTIKLSFN